MSKYSNRAGLNEDYLNQHKQNLVTNLMKYFVLLTAKQKQKFRFWISDIFDVCHLFYPFDGWNQFCIVN